MSPPSPAVPPPPAAAVSATRRPSVIPRAVFAALLFLLLCAERFAGYYPPLPNPLRFELVLEPGVAGRADPIIVSGETNHGDFLLVRFDDDRTVRFLYDRWGLPNLPSTPVIVGSPGTELEFAL